MDLAKDGSEDGTITPTEKEDRMIPPSHVQNEAGMIPKPG